MDAIIARLHTLKQFDASRRTGRNIQSKKMVTAGDTCARI